MLIHKVHERGIGIVYRFYIYIYIYILYITKFEIRSRKEPAINFLHFLVEDFHPYLTHPVNRAQSFITVGEKLAGGDGCLPTVQLTSIPEEKSEISSCKRRTDVDGRTVHWKNRFHGERNVPIMDPPPLEEAVTKGEKGRNIGLLLLRATTSHIRDNSPDYFPSPIYSKNS